MNAMIINLPFGVGCIGSDIIVSPTNGVLIHCCWHVVLKKLRCGHQSLIGKKFPAIVKRFPSLVKLFSRNSKTFVLIGKIVSRSSKKFSRIGKKFSRFGKKFSRNSKVCQRCPKIQLLKKLRCGQQFLLLKESRVGN